MARKKPRKAGMALKKVRKDPAAVALGRKRMAKASPEERRQIGSKGGKRRFAGWTTEEISAEMKRVRAAAIAKKKS
jgi:hypothetical protein